MFVADVLGGIKIVARDVAYGCWENNIPSNLGSGEGNGPITWCSRPLVSLPTSTCVPHPIASREVGPRPHHVLHRNTAYPSAIPSPASPAADCDS